MIKHPCREEWLTSEQTSVGVYQLAGSMSPLNWTRATEFLPERWLPENKQEFAGDHQDASRAFSYGPRDCIGKKYATGTLLGA